MWQKVQLPSFSCFNFFRYSLVRCTNIWGTLSRTMTLLSFKFSCMRLKFWLNVFRFWFSCKQESQIKIVEVRHTNKPKHYIQLSYIVLVPLLQRKQLINSQNMVKKEQINPGYKTKIPEKPSKFHSWILNRERSCYPFPGFQMFPLAIWWCPGLCYWSGSGQCHYWRVWVQFVPWRGIQTETQMLDLIKPAWGEWQQQSVQSAFIIACNG